MKKTILLFVFAIVTTLTAQAQMQAPGVGIRAGANYSGFSGDDADNLDRMFGFHAGLTSQFYLTSDNFFAIQPELLFSTKGAESKDDTFKYKISYLDVPVLARINAGPLYFEGGPQASFRIGGDIESNNVNIDDDLDQFKRTSFGYAAGIGLAATSLGLSIGVRYNGDISKLNENDNVSDARNDVFMLTLAYMFSGR
ncbi:porin family protein [Pontibacter cellulosilyticus]|uniref:PorT family protein n=1 Tax=Pontibacter cellulosilyticus TaxID=1720253 RepID=A0A923SLB3_9BACT|nr:porin family protein [Pontibacter cellulosilyticus]MBC5994691.1 PorT family protein [Pontibacter cellulosilyticus]